MMKVKKFNNLWLMGLIICAGLLVVIYFIKLLFPNFVIEISHIDSIVKFGVFIDSHIWLSYIVNGILSYIICYLICCACCGKKFLSWKEDLIILTTIVVVYLSREFMPKQYTVINLCSTLILPLIFKGKFFNTVIVFTCTNLLQTITLEIRNLSTMVFSFNFATMIILMVDYYVVLALLYLIFNYKKGD